MTNRSTSNTKAEYMDHINARREMSNDMKAIKFSSPIINLSKFNLIHSIKRNANLLVSLNQSKNEDNIVENTAIKVPLALNVYKSPAIPKTVQRTKSRVQSIPAILIDKSLVPLDSNNSDKPNRLSITRVTRTSLLSNLINHSIQPSTDSKPQHIYTAIQPTIQKSYIKIFKQATIRLINSLKFIKILSVALFQPLQVGWEYDILDQYQRSSDINKHVFAGILTTPIRNIFRKQKEFLTIQDVGILQRFCSPMHVFRRFTAIVQKELLKCGQYEKWESGRMLIRQGHTPLMFYIILDGECEVYQQQPPIQNDTSPITKLEKRMKRFESDSLPHIRLAVLKAGHGFGDTAFLGNIPRTATIKSKTVLEVLMIDKDNFLRIIDLAKQSGGSDAGIKLVAFQNTCPLFSSIVFPVVLSNCCELRSFSSLETYVSPILIQNSFDRIITEGDVCDKIWFINSGTCNVSKTLNFVKETFPNGKTRMHALPIEYQQKTISFDFKMIDIETLIQEKVILPAYKRSTFTVTTFLVVIGELGPKQHFGQCGTFVKDVKEQNNMNKSQFTLDHSNSFISDKEWFGRDGSPYNNVSITANESVELIGINKTDFHTFASLLTWKIFGSERDERWNTTDLLEEFIDVEERKKNSNTLMCMTVDDMKTKKHQKMMVDFEKRNNQEFALFKQLHCIG